jgi:hypothetical protein
MTEQYEKYRKLQCNFNFELDYLRKTIHKLTVDLRNVNDPFQRLIGALIAKDCMEKKMQGVSPSFQISKKFQT